MLWDMQRFAYDLLWAAEVPEAAPSWGSCCTATAILDAGSCRNLSGHISGIPTLLWKMAIEIVDFPETNMEIFYSYVRLPQGTVHKGRAWERNEIKKIGKYWNGLVLSAVEAAICFAGLQFGKPNEPSPICQWAVKSSKVGGLLGWRHDPLLHRCSTLDSCYGCNAKVQPLERNGFLAEGQDPKPVRIGSRSFLVLSSLLSIVIGCYWS